MSETPVPETPSASREPASAERPTRERALRHLLFTTIPVGLFTAAHAGTIYWLADLAAWETVSRATYYAWRDATQTWEFLGAFWLLGNFAPAWVAFSWYGFWLRASGYDGPPSRSLEVFLTACLALMPWLWPAALVRDPRLVLRNYKRRFRGETLYFMGEEGAWVSPEYASRKEEEE